MNTTTPRPATRDQAKQRAHALRRQSAENGLTISLATALERVAGELGYRDWNTASARLSNEPPRPLQVGDRVAGTYLKQSFAGRVMAVRELSGGTGYQITVMFDAPVDVVAFESFSNFRQRIDATISPDGVSWSKTSDGQPHLVIRRA